MHNRNHYPDLGRDDPRLLVAWMLLGLLGLLAAVGAGSVARWCVRRFA